MKTELARKNTIPSAHWWSEKNRYKNHYYADREERAETPPDKSPAAETSQSKLIDPELYKIFSRVFFTSIPFFHYISPMLDMVTFFGIETVIIWDHTKKAIQGEKAFKNLMYFIDDILTVASIFSKSLWPGRIATVMEAGMSCHRAFVAKSFKQKLTYGVQFIGHTTSLAADLQKNQKLKLISGLARSALSALQAKNDWDNNLWIETGSNLAQMAIKLFAAISDGRTKEDSLAPA